MVRLSSLSQAEKAYLDSLPCPTFDAQPWVSGPPLRQRRVALVSTAGLFRQGDRPFAPLGADYRVIPGDLPARELAMSHISANFDRTGFVQDYNVVFPLDRLRELAEMGKIGSVAGFHYSFMGAVPPEEMEPAARRLAGLLKGDGVNAVVLVPV